MANFRVASTERRYDRATGGWVDGDKLFLDVTCWRRLAENAFASLVKGDPWSSPAGSTPASYEHEGQRRSAVTLEAQSVAADLAWCTAVLTRTDAAAPSARTAGDDHRERPRRPPTAPRHRRRRPRRASRLVGAAPGGEG